MYRFITFGVVLVALAACAIKEGEWNVAYDSQVWGKLGTTSGDELARQRCASAGMFVDQMESFYGAKNGVRYTCRQAR